MLKGVYIAHAYMCSNHSMLISRLNWSCYISWWVYSMYINNLYCDCFIGTAGNTRSSPWFWLTTEHIEHTRLLWSTLSTSFCCYWNHRANNFPSAAQISDCCWSPACSSGWHGAWCEYSVYSTQSSRYTYYTCMYILHNIILICITMI